MGFAAAVAAVLDALEADPAMAAVTIKDYPPDQLNRSLILMAYPLETDWGPATHETYDGTGDLRIALHKQRSDTAAGGLEADIAALLPYVDAVPRILLRAWATHRLFDTVQGIGRPGQRPLRADRPSPDNWSGLDTVSIRWAFTITPNQEDL